jgi:RNA polymerase sigma-70 factor (ECF subfamily)
MPRPPDTSPKPVSTQTGRTRGREADRSRVSPTQRSGSHPGFGGPDSEYAFNALDATRAEQDRGEDRVLLARAGQGDEVAVRKLYRAHAAKLLRHAARILGASDPDVEDVVQQAFLAALDGASRFDGRSSVQTWLFGIVTRRALDAARASYRRRRFSRVLESVGLGGDSQSAPDRAYQAATEVERTLGELSPLQRAVFVLHDIEGYTFAEISGLTDVGISTLHGRLLSARKCIDSLVTHGEGGDDA